MGSGSHERHKKGIELERQDKDLLSIYMCMTQTNDVDRLLQHRTHKSRPPSFLSSSLPCEFKEVTNKHSYPNRYKMIDFT